MLSRKSKNSSIKIIQFWMNCIELYSEKDSHSKFNVFFLKNYITLNKLISSIHSDRVTVDDIKLLVKLTDKFKKLN
ncbi:hypothetical protein A9Q84_00230 [Halobacteriovorax marinus]|uniref:Uncharacterized protein n=1 Tax=Halobacteriovorax marinus TaxID=97084 RepID=A0A1Y5FH63_9BACT|nr:hypothetical protein A9Q84_00230 [Halobacteriovorax marinus]